MLFRSTACRVVVISLLRKLFGKHMMENIGAHGAQKLVFCFKVGVECAASDIGLVNNLLYRNILKTFGFQQGAECLKNRFACFLLSSVHSQPPEQIRQSVL